MTAILGISAFHHDAAAALLVDGEIVAAAQEERFTRTKHDARFPQEALDYCLAHAGLAPEEIDHVGFFDKPLRKLDRQLQTYAAFAPHGLRSFLETMPAWIKRKLHHPREIRRGLQRRYTKPIVFCEHHESHAASAFYPSPFEEAAILTLDGMGEWATTSIGVGRGHRIELDRELHFPHSLGLLYSAFTAFCGFRPFSGESKLMGLAPYGEPQHVDLILETLLDAKEDGSFRLDSTYFRYGQGLPAMTPAFAALLGRPARVPEGPLTQSDMDLAASVQEVTERLVVGIARHARERTGQSNLCLAGDLALNCLANTRLIGAGLFDNVWIQPAASDAGGALGVALHIWHRLLDKPRTPEPTDSMRASKLGPGFHSDAIQAFLELEEARFRRIDEEYELCDVVARHLADGKVVGWFQGRMEFGARSLGARSILGDPRSEAMQRQMNLKIKFRESFRPLAPSILAERADAWFVLDAGGESPYMLKVAPVADAKRTGPEGTAAGHVGLDQLDTKRSEIPAVTHVDGTSRVHTVDAERDPRFHRLLTAFERLTGCPVLINSGFNVRGEPIVCTPADAWRSFLGTDMDVLVLEDLVLEKADQPTSLIPSRAEFLKQFVLD